jgi:hypothetical protein
MATEPKTEDEKFQDRCEPELGTANWLIHKIVKQNMDRMLMAVPERFPQQLRALDAD